MLLIIFLHRSPQVKFSADNFIFNNVFKHVKQMHYSFSKFILGSVNKWPQFVISSRWRTYCGLNCC